MFLICVFTCVCLLCYDNVCSKLTKRGRRKLPSHIMTCQSKSGTTFLTFLSFRSILSIWFSTYRAPIYYKGIFIYLSVCAYLRNYFIAIIRHVKTQFFWCTDDVEDLDYIFSSSVWSTCHEISASSLWASSIM